MLYHRVLVVSPFSPFPSDAGHRRRVRQQLEYLKNNNFHVSLMLVQFEGHAFWNNNHNYIKEINNLVDEYYWYPGGTSIGFPPKNGDHHELDEWIDENLTYFFSSLSRRGKYDAIIIHNVWLTKLFDFAPNSALKILEIHDIFSKRYDFYKNKKLNPDFFLPLEKDEIFGWNRSDLIISIQEDESEFIKSKCNIDVIDVSYVPTWLSPIPLQKYKYKSEDYVTIGFIATAHPFNISGINSFIDAMEKLIKSSHSAILLRVAGSVCGHISNKGWIEKLGIVESEQEFIDSVDIIIVPVYEGTGFKVKTIDTLYFGCPMICSSHAATGTGLSDDLIFETALHMATEIDKISFERPCLDNLIYEQRHVLLNYLSKYKNQINNFVNYTVNWRNRFIIYLPDEKIEENYGNLKMLLLHLVYEDYVDILIVCNKNFGSKLNIYFDSRLKIISDKEIVLEDDLNNRTEIIFNNNASSAGFHKYVSFSNAQKRSYDRKTNPLAMKFANERLKALDWHPVLRTIPMERKCIDTVVVCHPNLMLMHKDENDQNKFIFVEKDILTVYNIVKILVSSERVNTIIIIGDDQNIVSGLKDVLLHFKSTRLSYTCNGSIVCDHEDMDKIFKLYKDISKNNKKLLNEYLLDASRNILGVIPFMKNHSSC